MREAGANNADLADAVGVSRPTVTDWRNGKIKTMTAENAEGVCRFLKINYQWLIRGKQPIRAFPTSGKHEPQLSELDEIFVRIGADKTEMIMNLARSLDPGNS